MRPRDPGINLLKTQAASKRLGSHARSHSFRLVMYTGVGVEKLRISEISGNSGDRKCPAESRTLFVGRPNAIVFLQISPA
jgi:hypothetical protein